MIIVSGFSPFVGLNTFPTDSFFPKYFFLSSVADPRFPKMSPTPGEFFTKVVNSKSRISYFSFQKYLE